MTDISRIISYFRDCYLADTRTLSLTNFFSTKVENKLVIDGEDELLNGHLPYLPVSKKYFDEVSKNLTLYSKEKELYACAFFIMGTSEASMEKSHKICAPLFLYPARLVEKEGLHFVEIDTGKRILNNNFLSTLEGNDKLDLFETLNREVTPGYISFESVGKIKRVLESELLDFVGDEILHYPELMSEAALKRQLQPRVLKKTPGFKIVSSLAFGVIKKSNYTLGILNELDDISKSQNESELIRNLFDPQFRYAVPQLEEGYVPAVLNESQHSILQSVNRNPFTLVIGPPGTGKSYSIAALAIEFMSKGKSVLISSKTNQAVDVIAGKIERDLNVPNIVTRAGKRNYKKELRAKLEGRLSSIRSRKVKNSQRDALLAIEKELKMRAHSLETLEGEFLDQAENELSWAKYLAENGHKQGFFVRFRKSYINWRNGLQDPHWKVIARLFDHLEEKILLIREHIALGFEEQIKRAIITNRQVFRMFISAIKSRYSSKQERLFKEIDYAILFQTLPVWLVNMSEIHDFLPLQKNQFDLAIIDEASQCDIASCLPIFYRAKRVVVVGDPRQLRHMSFLSESVQQSLRAKHGLADNSMTLDYRNLSILDLVDNQIGDQRQVVFLDEHFRSNPDLIEFSNREFYESALRLMTTTPKRKYLKSLQLIDVDGVRGDNGANKQEAEKVIAIIKEIITDETTIEEHLAHSIGIISPFRDQVDFINTLLLKAFDINLIERHQILCATPYGFQGEERDVILLSFAIDDEAHSTAIYHINKPDVFNVSITRARSRQYILKSFKDLNNKGRYLGRYISSMTNVETGNGKYLNFEDDFLNAVKKKLDELSIKYWPGYEIAGMRVDMVVEYGESYFGINLIGFPGEFEGVLNVEELKILNRAGLPTFPLPYSYWYFDQDACVDELLNFMNYK